MGTHISKVKSVDLDVWTPEQMASIQKWGNRLANLYWEAHLRPGHIPADHKMDSFIRSKYESRRWALEGPPPSDPSVLDSEPRTAPTPTSATASTPSVTPTARAQTPTESLVTASASRSSITTRQPQPHQLLSTSIANRSQQSASQSALPAPQAQKPPQPAAKVAPSNELFSLDFHAPSSTPSNSNVSEAPKKDLKQDILSLYSTPATAAPSTFGQFSQAQSAWSNFDAQPAPQPAPVTSMMGTTGVGMWGVSSGWTATPSASAQPNVWGAPAAQPAQQQQSLFTTSDVWGSSSATAGGDLFTSSLPAAQKKDDAFGDIWGGFK